MIVYAAESLYWFNTTEPPYLIKGASNIARVTSHNSEQEVKSVSVVTRSLSAGVATNGKC